MPINTINSFINLIYGEINDNSGALMVRRRLKIYSLNSYFIFLGAKVRQDCRNSVANYAFTPKIVAYDGFLR